MLPPWEKLENIHFDVDKMSAQLEELIEKFGQPPVYGHGAFCGFGILGDSTDPFSGFKHMDQSETVNARANIAGLSYTFNYKTEACYGYFNEMVEELDSLGFYPRRVRLTRIPPLGTLGLHRDGRHHFYCVRLHIPFITNPDCHYEAEGCGQVHMPADGHGWLINTAYRHRVINRQPKFRWHFMCEAWDTKGMSEHFDVNKVDVDMKTLLPVVQNEIIG